MEKITKKEMFGMMLLAEGIVGNELFENFINHEIELLNKKKNSKSATKLQEENIVIKGIIEGVLATSDLPLSISQLQTESEELAKLTNQKISALLSQMVKDGIVERIKEKNGSKFRLTDL